MNDRIVLISVDVETSGKDPRIHVPLSVGVVAPGKRNSLYREVEWDSIVVDPTALAYNRFDFSNYGCSLGPVEPAMVVKEICAFVEEASKPDEIEDVLPRTEVRILGKNPRFDLDMLFRLWEEAPGTPWPFSYRTVDLNSLFVGIAIASGRHPDDVKMEVTRTANLKLEELFPDLYVKGEHHAHYDAWWNVLAWRVCLGKLNTDSMVDLPALFGMKK